MSTGSTLLDTYSVRIMLGWIGSLTLLLLIVHLPFSSSQSKIGWGAQPSPERIALSEVEPEESEQTKAPTPEGAPPPTRASRTESPQPSENAPNTQTEETDSEELATASNVRTMNALRVSDRTPEIIGGMGSLYLHINYPEEARNKGIQGRLLLEFTVSPEGKAHSIEVAESLHPLCDSAAVAGIRSVKFVPAKHNGKEVPVRMRLPIRFRLISDSTGVETATANSTPPSQ